MQFIKFHARISLLESSGILKTFIIFAVELLVYSCGNAADSFLSLFWTYTISDCLYTTTNHALRPIMDSQTQLLM